MFHLGSIGRTSIDVDLSFLILIVLFVTMSYDPRVGVQYALLWAPVLFISVLVHELAHAATIGILGFGSSQIVLGGMGGVTMNQRRARPWQDFLISIAGPLSSFGLAFACTFVAMTVAISDPFFANLLRYLRAANFFWGIFNLIPVAPLDGGHAVRHFFRMFLTERNAFVIAVWIGIVGGSAAAVYSALQGQFFIALFVGWFVFQNYQAWQYFRDHGIPGD